MATIKDVANMAGVSVSTVSHVINGTRPVDPATEEKVREAIKILNYRPNLIARGLRRRVTHTIGLLVPDNSNPFFAEMARAIEDAGFRSGYSVILCNSDLSDAKQSNYIDVLLAKQVDGILFISSGNRPEPVRRVLSAGVPLVVVDRDLGTLPVDQVMVDNEQGGYIAGKYLADLGHKHIACIAGPSDVTPSAMRIAGFRQALAEAGIELPEDRVVRGDGRFEGGERAMNELLEKGIDMTAVFAYNDLMAIGAIGAIRRKGLRVPDDISIIGFDDIPIAQAMVPAITTIAQPIEELASTAVGLLLERIKDKGKQITRVVLPTSLVVRESCRSV
ncbi:transcriptional regulator, LacI family [Thermobaculum terrenum ATCC BAA-798]|uniref:Transcriptional regulator, LacI family n=1 Tax=Thermobaculum terrenum (strain ATCC BAA-798 / CCMEE 7001 / YNP1) TaxID=525904 RepID=D1CFN9_THET1|nr:LacI family DNA-binding transcriptional regulator [Thermobaculum terrenum]ACZ41745.1 transcriptional regulator, LacI family [Thermobaculum terrenum ATCC BAA-798]